MTIRRSLIKALNPIRLRQLLNHHNHKFGTSTLEGKAPHKCQKNCRLQRHVRGARHADGSRAATERYQIAKNKKQAHLRQKGEAG